jgi:putative endonuclease
MPSKFKTKKTNTSYWVYMVRTSANTLYTGSTNNLLVRIKKHQKGSGAKYLRAFKNIELVYVEKCKNKSVALRREYAIKQLSKKQKETLITPGK